MSFPGSFDASHSLEPNNCSAFRIASNLRVLMHLPFAILRMHYIFYSGSVGCRFYSRLKRNSKRLCFINEILHKVLPWFLDLQQLYGDPFQESIFSVVLYLYGNF